MNAPKPTSPRALAALLAAHDIQLSKRLGQNFLCDDHVTARIVDAVDEGLGVLEIGPGAGALTGPLARRAPALLAVEIDARLIPLLRAQLAEHPHATLWHGDILDADFAAAAGVLGDPFAVVGNLPYQITSPLLDALVRQRRRIAQAVLMVQRELADKVLAPVGGGRGNALGVFLQAYADARTLFRVPRTVFFPRPQVDATVFELRFLQTPRFSADEALFFRVVRASFNLRRKTLRQALIQSPFLALPAPRADAALARAAIAPQRRGETLTLVEFDRLARALEAGGLEADPPND